MAEEKNNWIPEIMYEESSGEGSSNLPFIQVPQGEEMPKLLFMFESRQTDESETDSDGKELPVYEWDLHQYANMAVLKERLKSGICRSVISVRKHLSGLVATCGNLLRDLAF